MAIVYIFSYPSQQTTARYFERVLKNTENDVIYWDTKPNIAALQPDDVFLFIDPAPDWPFGLEAAPCVTIAYLIDVHQGLTSHLQLSRFFDQVYIAQKDYETRFRELANPRTDWLPLGCDPDIHYIPGEKRVIDIGFVGQLGPIGTSRHTILTKVLHRYQTNDYKKFYPPREMSRIYSRSKIVFNASINGDLNMRFFEALASGALLITDRIENGLGDLFEEDKHYVGYSTADEAIEKIDYYLANPTEREQIAQAGQALAFSGHTYQKRWETIANQIADHHPLGLAPARNYGRKELGVLYSEIFTGLRKPLRFMQIFWIYSVSGPVLKNFLTGLARWANAHIPMTPNAIKARFFA